MAVNSAFCFLEHKSGTWKRSKSLRKVISLARNKLIARYITRAAYEFLITRSEQQQMLHPSGIRFSRDYTWFFQRDWMNSQVGRQEFWMPVVTRTVGNPETPYRRDVDPLWDSTKWGSIQNITDQVSARTAFWRKKDLLDHGWLFCFD